MPPRSRRLARRAAAWALFTDLIPLYAVCALLFADNGLSQRQISALFALWSVVGVIAEVPSGAAGRLRSAALGAMLAAGAPALAAAAVAARPIGLVLVMAFYALYRVVLVIAGARLQHRIESSARATVTSVAGLGH